MANTARPKRKADPATLSFTTRVRDLVHGFVYLTELEERIIGPPLFQRLRHVRQNDVASYVYPSLNTSRFEHALGCATVAGKMAASLCRSPQWDDYQSALGIEAQFEQTCRLYALLHDVGHLPLSHLFEMAFDLYAATLSPAIPLMALCEQWFGVSGFTKLHEASGSAITRAILEDVPPPAPIRDAILRLMSVKRLDVADPLRPVKLLVDSEIDADRIDFTKRDGLLAGGEYGTYDIERLCSAVFLQRHDEDWRLAYSHKALGSIEALLLDRCRSYTWIHFHHRIMALKLAARFVIESMLREGTISKPDFPTGDVRTMALRDDVWLLNLIRTWTPRDGDTAALGGQPVQLSCTVRSRESTFSGRIGPRITSCGAVWRTQHRSAGSISLDTATRHG